MEENNYYLAFIFITTWFMINTMAADSRNMARLSFFITLFLLGFLEIKVKPMVENYLILLISLSIIVFLLFLLFVYAARQHGKTKAILVIYSFILLVTLLFVKGCS